MYCISCKNNCVEPIDISIKSLKGEEDMLWRKEERDNIKDGYYTVNNSIVDGGIIHIVDAGFGSRYDGDQIIIAICDDCIAKNLEDSTLLYFSGSYNSSDNLVKQSKSRYRRRKNLDKLTE